MFADANTNIGYNKKYSCIVRVNNREYRTDNFYDSEPLPRENAAMRAYLLCRNFSVNDGMYPAGYDHGGVVQGIPVAIGMGRGKKTRDSTQEEVGYYDDDSSTVSSSDIDLPLSDSLGSCSQSGSEWD